MGVVIGDTAEIETGELLIRKSCLCPTALRTSNYKCLNIAFTTIMISFRQTYVMNRNEFCMLTAVFLFIQQYELVFVLSHGTFTGSFYVVAVHREKVKWL